MVISFLVGLRPRWSREAFYRALRATLVIPGLFAIRDRVIGNPQITTFAAFGGFAPLVLANFGGRRRDKLVAHLGLAVFGSLLILIGTAVSADTALDATITVPVVFCVLFSGLAGANVASGATAALLAYVLPAASAGTIGMVPNRLAGWWLAAIGGTIAVLVVSPAPVTERTRAAAASVAGALADELDAGLDGGLDDELRSRTAAARGALRAASAASPYRPTGLALVGQAIVNLLESLQWCAELVRDALADCVSTLEGAEVDRWP